MMTIAMKHVVGVRWNLARVLILILAGGFAGLMMDIRVEHVDVARKHAVAWVPIIYAGLMAAACFGTAVVWTDASRLAVRLLFILAFGVGGLGFYFHNKGNLSQVMRTSIAAWTDRTLHHSEDPPQVAPLAFAGLGVIGILVTLKRFDLKPATPFE